MVFRGLLVCLALAATSAAVAQAPPTPDTTPHRLQLVTVENGVQVEVIDWGGSGRPIILIPGLGATAHYFDKFAVKLTSQYHVYGITRRGLAPSSTPEPAGDNYSATRLGSDVLAVIDALNIDRPILVGWSFGGGELSAVAGRDAAKLAGLIYLDGGYSYAFYAPGNLTPTHVNLQMDARELNRALKRLDETVSIRGRHAIAKEIQTAILPNMQIDLKAVTDMLGRLPEFEDLSPSLPNPDQLQERIFQAYFDGMEKHAAPKVPVLAIFAVNQNKNGLGPKSPASAVVSAPLWDAETVKQIDRFARGNPSAQVVRLDGRHAIFNSNEAEVIQAMNAFIAKLP